jgi:AcrR family transcriptional regulator
VPRDRKKTRLEILHAVGRVLARSGFRELGVNSIAREAGVDKVLIYRYFGGLPQLLKAFAKESGFWPDLGELEGETNKSAVLMTETERAKRLVLAFGRALRGRPLTQEIMRWELLEQNELTRALAQYREEQGVKVFQQIEESGDGAADTRAIGSLLAAGLTYLILRSRVSSVYNGLHLDTEEDWLRIERAAGFLVEAAFAARDAMKAQPALKPRRRADNRK